MRSKTVLLRSIIIIGSILLVINNCQSVLFEKPQIISTYEGKIAVWGPIIIKFPLSITDQIANLVVEIEPDVPIRKEWQDNLLRVFPEVPFSSNSIYRLKLIIKFESLNKEIISESFQYDIAIRRPCLVYIKNPSKEPELTIFCENSSIQLTSTNGGIIDFSNSWDGENILYSQINDKEGSNIWVIHRDQYQQELLVDCGSDHCFSTNLSPDGHSMAYIQESIKANLDGVEKNQKIIIRDISSGEENEVLAEKNLSCTSLQWSPNGDYLTFFDSYTSSIWLWDSRNNELIILPSGENQLGNWSLDSKQMIYSAPVYWGGIAYDELWVWDSTTKSSQRTIVNAALSWHIISPQIQPGGGLIAMTRRPLEGSASSQIYMYDTSKDNFVQISENQQLNYSAIRWNPEGDSICYQTFDFSNQRGSPEVFIWDLEKNTHRLVEIDASNPQWIP